MRAVWEEQTSKWWFCAADIAEACRQLKLTAKDGKRHLTDVVDEEWVNAIIAIIPSKKALVFDKWLKGERLWC